MGTRPQGPTMAESSDDKKSKKTAVMVMSKADAFTQAGKTAVLQNIQGTLQFLQRFPPFNQMEHAHLAFLVEQCQLRFYAPGESIIKPADGPVEHFYIVKQGRVVGERPHTAKAGTETTFEITTGECFPWPRCWANGRPAPSTWPPKTPSACS
jgi:CBS domain-containing protein